MCCATGSRSTGISPFSASVAISRVCKPLRLHEQARRNIGPIHIARNSREFDDECIMARAKRNFPLALALRTRIAKEEPDVFVAELAV
jgi:hypothetical protein